MSRLANRILDLLARLLDRRKGYRLLFTHKEPPRSPLLDLPFDIVFLIFPHLSVVSKACLALTCKSFYALLFPVLASEDLAWPRLLSSPSHHRERFTSQTGVPRNDFLRRLQDARWWYCDGCLKLHPKERSGGGFARPSLSAPYCSFGYSDPKGPNIVDLCACLALTCADSRRLVQWLVTGKEPCTALHRRTRQAFQFRVRNGTPVLMHDCSVTSQPDAFVRLAMEVKLDKEDPKYGTSLVITTTYHIHWSEPRPCPEAGAGRPRPANPYWAAPNVQPIALCPHLHAIAWLYGKWTNIRIGSLCRICYERHSVLGYSDDGRYCCVQSVRNLDSFGWESGHRSPSNKIWKLWYRQ